MSLSFLEVPQANSASDDELRKSGIEGVTPDQSENVIAEHEHGLGAPGNFG